MMHQNTELRFISEDIGYGVVATRDIPKGTITWVQDSLDQEFTPSQVEGLGVRYAEILDKYCFRNQRGHWILCWDHARFVNHSFRSNCLSTAYNFEIAIRDIRAGEELTDDYGYLNITHPFQAKDEGCDRTTVYPDDLLRHHAEWDAVLMSVWGEISGLDQPLLPFLATGVWSKVCKIGEGKMRMASILECYFDGTQVPSVRPSGRIREMSG